MINFRPLSTPRLQVTLRELAGDDAIYLCQLPKEEPERGASELIQRIVVPSEAPRQGQETDPRLWSVQERALVIAHYLAHVIGGDFAIGDDAKFSDYLIRDGVGAPPDAVEIGEVSGKRWMLQPLLGWHAESIERIILAGELWSNRAGWLIGAMAAQMYHVEQGPLTCHDAVDAVIDKALEERAKAIVKTPESEMMMLVALYEQHCSRMDHTFAMALGDDGVMFLPAQEVPDLPPARFLFSLAVREDTAAVFGPPSRVADRDGSVPEPGPDGGWADPGESPGRHLQVGDLQDLETGA